MNTQLKPRVKNINKAPLYKAPALWMLILLGFIALFSAGCHYKGYGYKLRPEYQLRLELNRDIQKVRNIDTILCKYSIGSEKVYFDEMLWENIPEAKRATLSDCLDTERHLKITALPEHPKEPIKMITARISNEERLVHMGFVSSDCWTCDISEKITEFRVHQDGLEFWLEEIPKEEQWD